MFLYDIGLCQERVKESAYETIQSHFARSAGEESNSPLAPNIIQTWPVV